jgi:hypothetical protein
MTCTTALGYAGWLRLPGRPWRMVAEDADRGECLTKLLDASDRAWSPHKDVLLLPAGEDPNAAPPRKAVR